tara:strand:+ start:1136 stop:1561 length:426 start_codon:yes stop_codon:yes gene_type:complete
MAEKKRVKLKRRTLTLQFEDSDFQGVEVVCDRSASLDTVMGVQSAAAEGDLEEMFRLLGGEVIQSWNIDDDGGNPIPATIEGVRQVDMELLLKISREWSMALGAVDAPLEPESNNGHIPAPALEGMEQFAESLPNPSTTDG